MVLLQLLTFTGLAILFLVALTQIIVPLFRGTQMFPIFRREQKLLNELDSVRQKKSEKELEQKIAQVKK